MAKYGMPNNDQASLYEAWLRHQPTRDLREMLADPEMPADETAFINDLIDSRRSPSRDEDPAEPVTASR